MVVSFDPWSVSEYWLGTCVLFNVHICDEEFFRKCKVYMARIPQKVINNLKTRSYKRLTNEQSVSPHCVCQSHWLRLRRPPVTGTPSLLATILIHSRQV